MIHIAPIIMIIFLNFYIYKYINKNAKSVNNINIFNNLYIYNDKKYKFQKLTFSNIHQKTKLLFNKNTKPFFFLLNILKHKDYYLTISKFIDLKINSNNNKYRSKNQKILIESLSEILIYNFKNSSKANIYLNYKQLKLNIKIQQKENKVIKYLIGKCLIELLCEILLYLFKLSTIIQHGEHTHIFKPCKNQIFNICKYYGIIKYNPNSNFLLTKYNFKNYNNLNLLFEELNKYNLLINKIHRYLRVMFN